MIICLRGHDPRLQLEDALALLVVTRFGAVEHSIASIRI